MLGLLWCNDSVSHWWPAYVCLVEQGEAHDVAAWSSTETWAVHAWAGLLQFHVRKREEKHEDRVVGAAVRRWRLAFQHLLLLPMVHEVGFPFGVGWQKWLGWFLCFRCIKPGTLGL